MASKEITTFIIDLSPSMAKKSNGRNFSDLDYGLNYFYDILASKILKGRKTDYISVIACHSPRTDNPFSSDGAFKNIEVISNKIAPKYEDLKRYKEILQPNMAEVEDDEGDCFESMLVGIGLLKDTQRLKFIRNVVVITNGESKIKSFDSQVADATERAVNEMDIKVILDGIDFDVGQEKDTDKSPEKLLNETGWKSVFNRYKGSEVFSATQLIERALYNPPLKKIKPMKAFKGQLRFGSDHSGNAENVGSVDQSALCFQVELYPALKVEKLPNGHQYKVDSEKKTVDRIKNVTDYFIKQSTNKGDKDDEVQASGNVSIANDDDSLENIPINPSEWTDGFKYSNYDLLTLDEDLLNSAKLPSELGMDILGFVRLKDLPYAYLTGESYYLLPEASCSYRNLLSFNGLCQSLIDLEGVGLIRYVQKSSEEIQICALMPSKVKVNENFVYSFIVIRLPFREDEKIGKFPLLTSIRTASGKSFTTSKDMDNIKHEKEEPNYDEDGEHKNKGLSESNLPNSSANKLMEAFILSRDLDKKENTTDKNEMDNCIITNKKIALKNDLLTSFPILGDGGASTRLLASSPAIHKFNLNIKKIILKSLETSKGLHEFLNNPDFIQENLIHSENDVTESTTNLFNLSNILNINTTADDDWLVNINKNSINSAKRLVREFDVKYLKKEEESKKKKKFPTNNNLNDVFMMKHAQGNYGADEAEYEQLPKVDDLLN